MRKIAIVVGLATASVTPANGKTSQFQVVALNPVDTQEMSGAGCSFRRGEAILLLTDYQSGVIRLKVAGKPSFPYDLRTRILGTRQIIFNAYDKKPQLNGFFTGGIGTFSIHIVPTKKMQANAEEEMSAPATMTIKFTFTDTTSRGTTTSSEVLSTHGLLSCFA